jgi:hypothetical protein
MSTSTKQDRDAERFRWLLAHYKSIGLAGGAKEPDTWCTTEQLRELIDEAIKREEEL